MGRLLREQATLVKRLGEVQVAMEAAMKATKRGSSAGAGRARHQAARRKRDATSGKFICHVDGGGGCGLTPPKTNMPNGDGEPHDRVTAASAANNDDDDSNEEENRDDAQVKEGGEAKTHDGSSKLTGTNPERRKPIKQRWQEETDPGAEVYENPLLRVDEDDEYDYDEDDNGVMAVARTPHRKGERPSLKAAVARARAAEEQVKELKGLVEALRTQVQGDYVVKAEELKEQGYKGDATDQVIILDMALDFSRVRVQTAERELKEMKKKLDAAETQTVHWRKRGEEAEAKLRIRVGEREARVVGAVEIATVQAEVEEARDETEEWKGRAEEAEAKLEERERERERERGEFEEKVAGIERELAKVDVMEEEMERLKKEAGKEAKGAAKACKLLASATVERDRLAVELDHAKVEGFRKGFEGSWRSARGAADYRPGHRAGGRAVQDQVRAPHAVNDQW